MTLPPSCAYFWGEDVFSIERAARTYARDLAPAGQQLEVHRVDLDDDAGEEAGGGGMARRRARALDDIEQYLGMSPLFGAGTLVLLRQPAGLLAEKDSRQRLVDLSAAIPPGNALCVTDVVASGAKAPAARGALHDAIREAGGLVQEFRAPAAGQLEPWLHQRARELGIELEPDAARTLADRVGGHVREGDVDRRRRTELASGELEKLALYRPGGTITSADVAALVAESIPASTWAFLDAIGSRSVAQAAMLGDRLLTEGVPMPVLVAQLHRRLRDLILVRDHLDSGSRPPQVVKALGLQPYRARKLAEQAQRWTMMALESALSELLELDLRSKGIALDGSTRQMSDRIDALALQTWLARHAVSTAR
jgi:DNA polymerase III delta subunit